MLHKLRNAIVSKLKQQSFTSDDEAFRFLMSILTGIFALIVHFLMLVIFTIFRSQIDTVKSCYHNFFIYYNIVSIFCYLLTFILIHKRKFAFFGTMLSLQGILCSVLLCFLTGLGTYGLVYIILMIMLQIQFNYASSKIRLSVFIVAIAALLACIIADAYVEPVLLLSESLKTVMVGVNIFVFVTGVVAVLFAVNFVGKVVDNLNKMKMEELIGQSYTDELTGLYNRRYAKKIFRGCLHNEKTFCVAMLDIDDFKLINDTYGHNCGDEVLIFLADFLTRHLRNIDVIIRWGGEEFLIILAGVDLESAYEVLEKLRHQISLQTIRTKEKDLKITVTMGVSILSDDVEGAIKSCDQKMYKGKRNGKNIVVID